MINNELDVPELMAAPADMYVVPDEVPRAYSQDMYDQQEANLGRVSPKHRHPGWSPLVPGTMYPRAAILTRMDILAHQLRVPGPGGLRHRTEDVDGYIRGLLITGILNRAQVARLTERPLQNVIRIAATISPEDRHKDVSVRGVFNPRLISHMTYAVGWLEKHSYVPVYVLRVLERSAEPSLCSLLTGISMSRLTRWASHPETLTKGYCVDPTRKEGKDTA